MKIKRILLFTLCLISLGQYQSGMAEAPLPDKAALRQYKKQQKRIKKHKKKAKRLQRFLNSRLGQWMVKRAIRKAQRKRHKQIKKTHRIDDGNNGWIMGALVFFAAGLLMAIVMAALAITNPWIIIPAITLTAFLALHFIVLRPRARRKRRKINRKWL